MFRRTCLQIHLQTSSPTAKNSYPKFQKDLQQDLEYNSEYFDVMMFKFLYTEQKLDADRFLKPLYVVGGLSSPVIGQRGSVWLSCLALIGQKKGTLRQPAGLSRESHPQVCPYNCSKQIVCSTSLDKTLG